ncbi:hypothetical protein A2625_07600 [candidate division WOR-1 bacterium RIFCSPHIGHO2_01_FULL_53_15]|uniref:Uncharacterized protein n=1 Tax=candidate division WOR-1 bacterium RIFCSPHIGHO2_01_FULL_53_15 TaxID=1802564 RepID=A0A1F4Q4S4_UNCSA|nr:MAG: hypothetical protein A2625_07600 [candidate division WOR-1 bacterium RIFCSPHIGHO2_01_FULL_53_15]OGC10562.1 MAG: hypothetical protein A3D23_01565 [candidate division WOR-1 bacterium RIFCSPHIGHO2_02_FULL_53_26]
MDNRSGRAAELFKFGASMIAEKNFSEAETAFREMIALNPVSSSAYNGLGYIQLFHANNPVEAKKSFAKAIALNPDNYEAYHNLAILFTRQNELPAAITNFKKAIAIKPEFDSAYIGLAETYANNNNLNLAKRHLIRLIDLKPDYFQAHHNLALLYIESKNYRAAKKHLLRAIALRPELPESHFSLGTLLLSKGGFKPGWAEFEWRTKLYRPEEKFCLSHPAPFWKGELIKDETILVSAEQGYGDVIQFARYIPLVRQKAARLVFQCDRNLIRLFQDFAGIDRIVDWDKGQECASEKIDRQISLLSLPRLFSTTPKNIPADIPYLFPDPALAAKWRSALAEIKGFRVGFVWTGKPTSANNPTRSMSLDLFSPLFQLKGCSFLSLQKGKAADELRPYLPKDNLIDLDQRITDFADTAALIANLDLVISVDTSVAHLAGAMGKLVWILLQHVPDWRWRLESKRSPWYPTARLFRQSKRGDWPGVVNRVKNELGLLLKKKGGTHARK